MPRSGPDASVRADEAGEVLRRVDRAGIEHEALGQRVLPPDLVLARRVDRPAEDVVHAGVDGDYALRRHAEVLHDVLAGHFGDGDDRRGPGGVAGDEEPVAHPVDEAGSPGHDVPVQAVADPDGGTLRPEGNGIFRVEQDVDAVPIHGGGTASWSQLRTERPGRATSSTDGSLP